MFAFPDRPPLFPESDHFNYNLCCGQTTKKALSFFSLFVSLPPRSHFPSPHPPQTFRFRPFFPTHCSRQKHCWHAVCLSIEDFFRAQKGGAPASTAIEIQYQVGRTRSKAQSRRRHHCDIAFALLSLRYRGGRFLRRETTEGAPAKRRRGEETVGESMGPPSPHAVAPSGNNFVSALGGQRKTIPAVFVGEISDGQLIFVR